MNMHFSRPRNPWVKVNPEREELTKRAKVLFHVGGMKIGVIAKILGKDHTTVRRWIDEDYRMMSNERTKKYWSSDRNKELKRIRYNKKRQLMRAMAKQIAGEWRNAVPTITIVTGDPKAGKALVGEAVRMYLDDVMNTPAFTLSAENEGMWRHTDLGSMYTDVILVSGGSTREPWMDFWIEKLGQPLFEIHVRRND